MVYWVMYAKRRIVYLMCLLCFIIMYRKPENGCGKRSLKSLLLMEHPLCLHDDRTLLHRARSRGRGQILHYNQRTGEKKALPIYDTKRCMSVYCYRDSTYRLPDSIQMTRLNVSEDGEEKKLRKRKRKSKSKRTTFEIVQPT